MSWVVLLLLTLSMAQEQVDLELDYDPGGASVAADRGAVIESLLTPFRYVAEGKRDPFKIPESIRPLPSKPVHGPFLPMQDLSLDDFILRGVFIHPDKSRALFEINRNGKKELLRLSVDDFIGPNFGYIASIKRSSVVVVQTKEQNGELFTSTKTIKLEK